MKVEDPNVQSFEYKGEKGFKVNFPKNRRWLWFPEGSPVHYIEKDINGEAFFFVSSDVPPVILLMEGE